MCSLMTKSVCLTKKVICSAGVEAYSGVLKQDLWSKCQYPSIIHSWKIFTIGPLLYNYFPHKTWNRKIKEIRTDWIGFQPIYFQDFIRGGWGCRDNINVIKSVINMVIWLVLSQFHWYINVYENCSETSNCF